MAINYSDCWTYPKEEIDRMLAELEQKTTELPKWTASDAGKVLMVNDEGTGLEWTSTVESN